MDMVLARFLTFIAVRGTACVPRKGERREYDGGVATEPIQALLERAFPEAAALRVEDRTGGGDHFQVTVESSRFNGLSLLDQHRLVNEALAEPLHDGTIHELRIKTRGTE
jgi:stress-induced morphogen